MRCIKPALVLLPLFAPFWRRQDGLAPKRASFFFEADAFVVEQTPHRTGSSSQRSVLAARQRARATSGPASRQCAPASSHAASPVNVADGGHPSVWPRYFPMTVCVATSEPRWPHSPQKASPPRAWSGWPQQTQPREPANPQNRALTIHAGLPPASILNLTRGLFGNPPPDSVPTNLALERVSAWIES